MSKWYNTYVPDVGPEDARILFVGEAPGEEEERNHEPFVGNSGLTLTNCLGRNGITRADVRLANLFHYRPWDNKFENVDNTPELAKSLGQLYAFIKEHRPTVIVPLGNFPLKYLTGRTGITKWRGSIIPCLIDPTIKCIPTFHPSYVSRDQSKYPIFDTDIKRVVSDSEFRDFRLPTYNFILRPTGLEREEWAQRIEQSEYLSIDIETIKGTHTILCVGFAVSVDTAVVFVPDTPEDRAAIQRGLNSNAKKILQNGTFDLLQLLYLNGYEFKDPYAESIGRPYYHDTLQSAHVSDPELPKSLEYLTSVDTRQPYYKSVGRGNIPDDSKAWSAKADKQSLYEYNAKDCCCTYAIAMVQINEGIQHNPIFDFEMQCLDTAMHISESGVLIDKDRRDMMKFSILKNISRRQALFNALVGWAVNVKSTPDMKKLLYEQLALPIQRKQRKVTTDEDAIVHLITLCKDKFDSYKTKDKKLEWQIKLTVCEQTLKLRGLRQLISNYLSKEPGADGRLHSHFKIQTETGRWNCSKFVDGTGFNAQTLPRDPYEIPDEDLTKDAEGNWKLLEAIAGEDTEEEDEDEE